jgi:hypothetical protein
VNQQIQSGYPSGIEGDASGQSQDLNQHLVHVKFETLRRHWRKPMVRKGRMRQIEEQQE